MRERSRKPRYTPCHTRRSVSSVLSTRGERAHADLDLDDRAQVDLVQVSRYEPRVSNLCQEPASTRLRPEHSRIMSALKIADSPPWRKDKTHLCEGGRAVCLLASGLVLALALRSVVDGFAPRRHGARCIPSELLLLSGGLQVVVARPLIAVSCESCGSGCGGRSKQMLLHTSKLCVQSSKVRDCKT